MLLLRVAISVGPHAGDKQLELNTGGLSVLFSSIPGGFQRYGHDFYEILWALQWVYLNLWALPGVYRILWLLPGVYLNLWALPGVYLNSWSLPGVYLIFFIIPGVYLILP